MKGIVLFLALLLVSSVAVAANVEKANPSDVAQAIAFLNRMPPACGKTYMDVSEDGTVNLHVLCERVGSEPAMDGLIRIKDGVVTEVR